MNFNSILQQAQKMQKELTKKISDFETKEFSYSYKNDSVVVNIRGDLTLTSLKINDILIDLEEKQMLEEMVSEAINFAINEVTNEKNKITSKSFPNSNIPGLF